MPRLILPASLALSACLVLAACGAEAPPQPPERSVVTVSGNAQIGVASK
jgi:outer membrane biogenesis lipoprotein LolB